MFSVVCYYTCHYHGIAIVLCSLKRFVVMQVARNPATTVDWDIYPDLVNIEGNRLILWI